MKLEMGTLKIASGANGALLNELKKKRSIFGSVRITLSVGGTDDVIGHFLLLFYWNMYDA